MWGRHMEIGGVEMPLGKGVSFYKINDEGEKNSCMAS
jgi:hypothetical protein